jgi:hypothetical protein
MLSHGWTSIDADTVSLAAAYWHAGKTQYAATALLHAFLSRYPLPGAEPHDIDVRELRLEPASA